MIGNLYVTLNTPELINNYQLYTVILNLLTNNHDIYKELENDYKTYKKSFKDLKVDSNFLPALLMDIAYSQTDIPHIIDRVYKQEFLDVDLYSKSWQDAHFLALLTYDLIEATSKEEVLNKSLNQINEEFNTLECMEAVRIFKECISFKDCLKKVEHKSPYVQAVALNLAEAYYNYIDPDLINNLNNKLITLGDTITLVNYNKMKESYIRNISKFKIDSPILFYHNLTDNSDITVCGKDVNQIFPYFINHILPDATLYCTDTTTLKNLNEQVKLYDNEQNQNYKFLNEKIIKPINKILKESKPQTKEILLFSDLFEFMEYIESIKYDGDLLRIV